MTRVWLEEWEWACCGDAFEIGDDVDFGIRTRTPESGLSKLLGAELAATVDAMESHHEDEFTDRVRGKVVGVNTVTVDVIDRRSLRRPGHGAPLDAVMPAPGEDWPMIVSGAGSDADGNEVLFGTLPTRYLIESERVPDSATLTPAGGVRSGTDDEAESIAPAAGRDTDPPPERRRQSFAGWLVDVDEFA